MSFSLKTEHDNVLDLVFIYPVGHLENEDDCIAMCDGWIEMLDAHPRNMYSLSIMDMFSVAPSAMAHYLAYVRKISTHHHGISVVVSFSAADSRAVSASIDAHAGDVLFASSIEQGIEMIQKIRENKARQRRHADATVR